MFHISHVKYNNSWAYYYVLWRIRGHLHSWCKLATWQNLQSTESKASNICSIYNISYYILVKVMLILSEESAELKLGDNKFNVFYHGLIGIAFFKQI